MKRLFAGLAAATVAVASSSAHSASNAGAAGDARSCTALVQRTVAQMTVPEKVGQLVMVLNGPGFGDYADTASLIRDHHIGSVVSLGYFGFSPADAAAHNNALQGLAAGTRLGIPILNAGDFEKGVTTLVDVGTTDLPNQLGLAATGRSRDATRVAEIVAAEALAMGFNWTFSPIADVLTNPGNGEIGVRSFGSDPKAVASLTARQVRAFQEDGLIATAKHFLGPGATDTNSHFALPVVTADRGELERVHLRPFRAAIDAGVETIMTANVLVEAIDPVLPASLSPAVTTGLLRQELGFGGVIVTDFMTAGGIMAGWEIGEAAVLAVKAGADIVMELGPTIVPLIALDALITAVETGEIRTKRVDASVRRILSLKCKYGLFENRYVDVAGANAAAGTPDNLEAAAPINRRAITLVKNDGVLPFDPSSGDTTLIAGVTHHPTVIDTPPASHVPELAAAVASVSSGPVLSSIAATEDPTGEEIAAAVTLADQADRILVATYSAGPLPDGQAQLVDALVATGKPVVAVSTGTPGDILRYPSVDAYIASYALNFLPTYIYAPAALRATVDVAFGAEPGGRLPVPIGDMYPLGHGLDYDHAVDDEGKTRSSIPRAVSAAAGAGSVLARAGPDYAFDVFLIRADGSDLRALTRTPGIDDHSPEWSPSGRSIAFVRFSKTSSNENDIWTIRRDARGSRRLVNEPGWAVSLSYSPDGRRIVYANSRVGHSSTISVADANGGGVLKLAEEPLPGRSFVRLPAWSPDGRTILYNLGRTDGLYTVVTVPAGGGEATVLGRGFRPRWSPDGKAILYTSGGQLWVMGADGGGAHPLAAAAPSSSYAEWAPDGRTIAFEYQRGIYVVPSAGGRPLRVAKSGTRPVWAPDSRRILFRDRTRSWTLYVGDRTGSPPRSLGVTVGQVATWSPDGRWIAFDSTPAGVRSSR